MNRTRPRLGIVEDHADLLEELLFYLQSQGYPAWGVGSAEALWRTLHAQPADIVLVDLGLPGEDGFEALRYLHELSNYGIIVISARGSIQDRMHALSLGADTYHIKPVNFADLTANIEALWARLQAQATTVGLPAQVPAEMAAETTAQTESQTTSTSHSGLDWLLDPVRACLFDPNGKSLPLTPQELALLEILHNVPGEVYSKIQLHEHLFGPNVEDIDTHRIDVILSRLRRKAQQQQFQLPIRTLFGRGLVFSASRSYRGK